MVYPTFYKIAYQNEISETISTSQGLLFSTSYGDAAEQIGKYYGENNILTLEIIQTEDNPLLQIDDIGIWYNILHLSNGTSFTDLQNIS